MERNGSPEREYVAQLTLRVASFPGLLSPVIEGLGTRLAARACMDLFRSSIQHSPDATVMLGSYAPVSQKGRVLRAVVKEMEGQQTATKFLLTTPPCLISATLQSVHALYNGCPRGCSGLLSVWRGQLCCTV